MVWYDSTPGNNEIFFKRSVDGGTTWQDDKRLTKTEDQSIYPAIAVDGPNVYVVWVDTKIQGNDEIYFKRSNDGGVTWQPKKRLTYNRGVSWNPDIAVNGKTYTWFGGIPLITKRKYILSAQRMEAQPGKMKNCLQTASLMPYVRK